LDEQSRAFLHGNHGLISPAQPPNPPGSKKRKSPGQEPLPEPPPKKKKDKARDAFLRNLPKAVEWHKRQIEIVENDEQYERIICSLTSHSRVHIKEEPDQKNPESEDELVTIGVNLALLTDSSLKNEKLQKSFSFFQLLVFFSYCAFLRNRGISREIIDRITQNVTSFREKDRRRLISRALWINSIISKLVKNGWSIYRATELFFISIFSKLLSLRK